MTQIKQKQPSKTAQARSTRLVAVQTLYGVLHTGEDIKEAVADVLARADTLEVHGEPLVKPNGALLQNILYGVNDRKKELQGIISANISISRGDTEMLLQAILLCASFELMAHHDIEIGIIINDYLDIAHGFYEPAQVKLVNGVLDSVSKVIR